MVAPRETGSSHGAPVVVFLGPTCPRDLAATVLADAEFRPPARKGDVYRLLQTDVATVVLIDGVFHGAPSVWHDEILAAVDEGIRVIGASSMGALRAAELHDLGVEGHGTVFEWYRDGAIDGDDEVALHHGSSDEGYVALSEPLVNIRATLLSACAAGHVRAEHAAALVAEVRETPYPERSYRRMMSGRTVAGWASAERAALAAFLQAGRVDQKRRDALGALQLARTGSDGGPRARRAPRRSERAALLSSERMAARVFRAPDGREARSDAVLAGATKLRLIEPSIALRTCRFCALRVAEATGVRVPRDEVGRIARRIASAHEGDERAAFLRRNALTPGEHGAWVEDEATFEWLRARASAVLGERWDDSRAALGARAFAQLDPRIAGGWGFVAAWAQREGLRCPEPARRAVAAEATRWGVDLAAPVLDELALARWVIARSPEAFGFSFGGKAAVVLELQAADRIAAVLAP